MRFSTASRELYLRKSNIRHQNWDEKFTNVVYGSKEARDAYENQKIPRFNRRTAFMHKTHLNTRNAAIVFDMLPINEQENWISTAETLTLDAQKEFQTRKNVVDYRKTLVGNTGPFGSRGSDIPIDVQELLTQLISYLRLT